MSFQNPANRTRRMTVLGMEGMHSKMFDPPSESPDTPDYVEPTNPVPEVMAAAGFLRSTEPDIPHTVQRTLLHGEKVDTWDGREMEFFLFADDKDGLDNGTDPGDPATPGLMINPSRGSFPGPTIRVPRGVIYHCITSSKKGPHTIHWHGHEPTTMNDGVGHCSFELGDYTYQFQPNFIGSYFHHCHRNTMQHFEFGLYGFTIVDPPDAFFASIASFNNNGTVSLNSTPIGNGRPEPGFPLGRRRIAANLANFPEFGQTSAERVPLESPDPQAGNPNLPAWLKFPTNPHAYTVPYDVEALWVFDDRDIRWSELASDHVKTFPKEGTIPGVNDNFYGKEGLPLAPGDFFAFNDFRSTHFYVTGFPVPDEAGFHRIPGAGQISPGVVIPPELMSGVSGVQVSINAETNQNILVRILNAAYNNVKVKFPVDVVIIAWDGRALGVPPFGSYNAPVRVPAGTEVEWSVARRFDCLIRSTVPVNSFATVEFIDTLRRDRRFTARIPIQIAGVPGASFLISGKVTTSTGAGLSGVTLTLTGAANRTVSTDGAGNYSLAGLPNGSYTITPSIEGSSFTPASRSVTINGANITGQDFAQVALRRTR